jgi:hypothetical protein
MVGADLRPDVHWPGSEDRASLGGHHSCRSVDFCGLPWIFRGYALQNHLFRKRKTRPIPTLRLRFVAQAQA